MRKALSALLLALIGLLPAAWAADAVHLVRVWPGYRDAASFTRVGEYFGAAPDALNRAALRSQPDARQGFYWLIRTDAASAQPGATLTLLVMRAGATAPERHSFAIDLPAGQHVLQAGLTGSDWPDAAERPVAWHLEISSSDGTPLATDQSFLWAADAP